LLVVGAITLLGFALRVNQLAVPSFWWDDSYATMVASGSLRDIVATLAREDFHPPLHYFLLHYWLRLVGTSEFSLRYLSVIAGVLAIPAAWIAGRRIFGPLAGVLAATLFALSPYLWYYSQEARMFALVPVLATLAVYFCARGARESRRLDWLGYTAIVLLGVYDFYYFAFVPLACGLWVILGQRRASVRGAWCVSTVATALLYLPWLPILLSRGAVWSGLVPSLEGPTKTVYWSWTALLLGLPSLALYAQPLPAALLGLGAIVTLGAILWSFGVPGALSLGPSPIRGGGMTSYSTAAGGKDDSALPFPAAGREGAPWRRGSEGRPGGEGLPTLAFVVPLGAMAAVAAVKPVFHPRYAIPAEAGLFLLLAGFVAYLLQRDGARRALGLGISVLLLGSCVYGFDHLKNDGSYARDDYRTAIGYVRQNEQPGDTIIHNAIPPFWYYYHGPSPATYFPTGAYTEANVATGLNQLTRGKQRMWYVTQIDTPSDPDGLVDAELRQHAALLTERHYAALRVELWQIPGDDTFAGPAFQPATINLASELAITGYAVGGEAVGGHSLDVALRVETRRVPSSDDGFWIAFVDSAGLEWGRADARPHDGAFNPSSRWTAGTSVVVRASVPIAVGTPPGTYDVVVGAYRLSDLAGLDVLDAGGHPIGQRARLGPLTVTRPSDGDADPALTQAQRAVSPGLVLAELKVGVASASPGDPVPVTLLWRPTGTLPPLRTSLQLRGPNGQLLASDDGPIGGAYPTEQWSVGHLVREQRSVVVPATFTGDSLQVTLLPTGGAPLALGTLPIRQVKREFSAPTPAHPLNAVFGEQIGLVGDSLASGPAKPGDRVTLTLDWHALKTPALSYRVFVHLIDASNHIWAQWDGVPRNWSYPTSAWMPGEYVSDDYSITLSPDTPAGPLSVETGLYDPATGQRLLVSGGVGPSTDHLVVGMVQVTPP
jgi:hypothetical protein